LIEEPFRLEADGTVKVPRSPGLGVRINEDVLRRYAQVSPMPLPGRQV